MNLALKKQILKELKLILKETKSSEYNEKLNQFREWYKDKEEYYKKYPAGELIKNIDYAQIPEEYVQVARYLTDPVNKKYWYWFGDSKCHSLSGIYASSPEGKQNCGAASLEFKVAQAIAANRSSQKQSYVVQNPVKSAFLGLVPFYNDPKTIANKEQEVNSAIQKIKQYIISNGLYASVSKIQGSEKTKAHYAYMENQDLFQNAPEEIVLSAKIILDPQNSQFVQDPNRPESNKLNNFELEIVNSLSSTHSSSKEAIAKDNYTADKVDDVIWLAKNDPDKLKIMIADTASIIDPTGLTDIYGGVKQISRGNIPDGILQAFMGLITGTFFVAGLPTEGASWAGIAGVKGLKISLKKGTKEAMKDVIKLISKSDNIIFAAEHSKITEIVKNAPILKEAQNRAKKVMQTGIRTGQEKAMLEYVLGGKLPLKLINGLPTGTRDLLIKRFAEQLFHFNVVSTPLQATMAYYTADVNLDKDNIERSNIYVKFKVFQNYCKKAKDIVATNDPKKIETSETDWKLELEDCETFVIDDSGQVNYNKQMAPYVARLKILKDQGTINKQQNENLEELITRKDRFQRVINNYFEKEKFSKYNVRSVSQ